MTVSKSFGTERAARPHLVRPGGGLKSEVDDLRRDLERGFSVTEGRTNFPEIDWIDGGAPAAAGGDAVIKGRLLLQGQTFASVTVATSLELIACTPGVTGNSYTVTVVDSGSGGLAVSMTGTALEIDLGGATPDEDTVATALNNASAYNYQAIRANSGGGGAIAVAAAASFTGGAGEGWQCLVSGVVSPVKHDTGAATSSANLAETAVTVTVPDLTAETDARAAGDIASIEITSDGVTSRTSAVALA